MHKLTRPWPEPPALAKAKATLGMSWDDLGTEERDSVRDALLDMQSQRCAYCECSLKGKPDWEGDGQRQVWNGHIEHFRRKHSSFHPELTFEWNNLFYSCMEKSTCGIHKDRVVKSKDECPLVIDPCRENPEDYLIFTRNGRVEARSGLTGQDKKRAEFTIRVFNLNEPRLVNSRKGVLNGCRWMKTCSDADRKNQLREWNDGGKPYVTAVCHFFGEKVR